MVVMAIAIVKKQFKRMMRKNKRVLEINRIEKYWSNWETSN